MDAPDGGGCGRVAGGAGQRFAGRHELLLLLQCHHLLGDCAESLASGGSCCRDTPPVPPQPAQPRSPSNPANGPHHPTHPWVLCHSGCNSQPTQPRSPSHGPRPTRSPVPILPLALAPIPPPAHNPPLQPGYAGPAGAAKRPGTPTLIEDPVNVEAVRGTGLVVEAPLHVPAERLSPGVLDHPGVGGADLVWGGNRGVRRGSSRPHPCGAGPTPPAHPGCPPAPGPPHWCPGSR